MPLCEIIQRAKTKGKVTFGDCLKMKTYPVSGAGFHFDSRTYKPNSVSRRDVGTIVIYLFCLLPDESSGTPTAPKRGGTALHTSKDFAVSLPALLWGLAP